MKRDIAEKARNCIRDAKREARVARNMLNHIGDSKAAEKAERIVKEAESLEEEINDKLDSQKG